MPQYRVGGRFVWMSSVGNAIVAIRNPVGSNKKLVIKAFEIQPASAQSTAGILAAPVPLNLSRASVTTGRLVPVTKHDTSSPGLPSEVTVHSGGYALGAQAVVGRVSVVRSTLPGGWVRQRSTGQQATISQFRSRSAAAVRPIVVSAGESVSLVIAAESGSVPLRVSAVVTVQGSPNHSYSISHVADQATAAEALLSVTNAVGSAAVVTVDSVAVEEIGGYDTPYFQLVPIGQINADSQSSARLLPPVPLDTDSPDASAYLIAYNDVAILPFGMPENAASESGAGAPKGFNYLKTKDFVGPVYRTFFPEMFSTRTLGASVDAFGYTARGHRCADLGVRRRRGVSDITIREGEALGLVAAAETATVAGVGMSGWALYDIQATISVEPKSTPTLSLTGLQIPTEVRVFIANTTTEIAGAENVVSGQFAWVYDPDAFPLVDISVLSLGYQNLRLKGISLGFSDVTIPVQQQLDRQYLNP